MRLKPHFVYIKKEGEQLKHIRVAIVRLLLFFYLTSSYLSAIHIHSDALEQPNECKVCLVVKNLHSGDASTVSLDNLGCWYCYEPLIFENFYTSPYLLKGFNANAPPYFIQ